MKLFYKLVTLTLMIALSNEECFVENSRGRYHASYIQCSNTSPENFVYDFFSMNSNHNNIHQDYSLEIVDSNFIEIHSFLDPFPRSSGTHLRRLVIQKSSVEFIENYAFENLIFMSSLVLSSNKLNDLSFVRTLPVSLESLSLNDNYFEVVSNVFHNLVNLSYVDLSRCKINTIESDSFSKLYNNLFLNFSQNYLTSFDVVFNDDVNLFVDLNYNSIKHVDLHNSKIELWGFFVRNNQIKNINEILRLANLKPNYEIGHLDLSYNELVINETDLLSSNEIGILKLSNSKIHNLTSFKVNVVDALDLSGNNLVNLPSYIFGDDIKFNSLNLFNASVTVIDKNAFNGLGKVWDATLNLSSNPISVLKDYVFNNTQIATLDISNCLIQKIEGNSFYNARLVGTLDLSNNQITYIKRTTFQNLNEVETINLSFNNIKKMDNNLFLKCEQLKILKLSNSKVEVIRSGTLNGTKNLKELDLRNNLLSNVDFKSSGFMDTLYLQENNMLYLSFSFLQNLSTNAITLTGNKIKTLKNSTVNRSFVKEIDLSSTSLYKIEAGAFRGLSRLEILNLSLNLINIILPGTFVPLKNLIKLDLKGNHIIAFSPSSFAFGNQLHSLNITVFISNFLNNTFSILNHLNTLNIFNSTILSLNEKSFNGLVNLENINLHHVSIDKVIPGAFNGLYNLKNFNCRDIVQNITVLKSGTFEGLRRLEILNLSKLSIYELEEEAFKGLITLERLFLNHNKIKTIINNTFLGLKYLKILNLSDNKISKLEPNAFFGLDNLVDLSLSNNNITDLSLVTLQNFPYLKVLNLCRNNISKLLTGTFSNLKHLIKLDLSYNNITKLKMDNLLSLTNLEHLDLTGNHLIEIKHLELLKSLRQLKYVSLNNNRWKCNYLASILMDFQNHSISWLSDKDATFSHENIDGIKCIDICKFFYCIDDYI